MASENQEIVAALYRAHRERDTESLLSLCHPEIEIVQTELLPWGGYYRGHSGVFQFIGKLTQFIEGTPEPLEFIEAENHVAVYGRLQGHLKTNGELFDIRIIHIWRLQEGQIRRFEAYVDTPVLLDLMKD